MALELHPWRFELEFFPSQLPCGHVFEPKLNALQGAICQAFFLKWFEQSTSWCFGSHFFVARSHRFIAICHCRFLTSFLFLKEKHGKKTPLSTFHCNQLQHTCLACFKTDLPDYFRFNFVQVVTEPCGSVVLSWCHGGHMTETWDFQLQMMQKHHVCFYSNQYFYIPQENVNLSNEQRVC